MRLKISKPFARMFKQQIQMGDFFLKATKPVAAVVADAAKMPSPATTHRQGPGRLKEVAVFGTNPGHLRMLEYVPPRLPAHAALVVVLHGCMQTAQSFDDGSGWTALAKERRFVVLYPEQKRSNNPNLCFNWFRPSAIARDRGELLSIRQMIDSACRRHRINPLRIYVAGLSAGGAMASALLATYPERFDGGAIIAGLPFGAARDAMTAMSVMKSGANRTAREWGDLVRHVTPAIARPPAISIWHGTGDSIVNILNAQASLRQWLDVYGLLEEAGRETIRPWGTLARWHDATGRAVISYYRIDGMGHGLPISRGGGLHLPDGEDRFMLEAGIAAPGELAKVWGIE